MPLHFPDKLTGLLRKSHILPSILVCSDLGGVWERRSRLRVAAPQDAEADHEHAGQCEYSQTGQQPRGSPSIKSDEVHDQTVIHYNESMSSPMWDDFAFPSRGCSPCTQWIQPFPLTMSVVQTKQPARLDAKSELTRP